jgi:hypothetical protein
VPEAITNKLLISATPRYYGDIMRLIQELDAELPQVVIQVMIAEVVLTGNEEFGVEIGLQSPVLFQRSIYPATSLLGNGTTTFTNVPNDNSFALGQTVPAGVTVNTTANPASILNYNFNNPTVGLGSNPIVNPGIVGFQGLGNLGTGRVGAGNVGGFVFSAASDSVNVLVRALKQQGRIEILSRPQIMTLDNQAAQVAVGQDVPYTTGTATAAATATTAIQYRPVGVILNVIPKINPDGKVVMRVTPQVSSFSSSQSLNLGNGVIAPVFNQQLLDTTIIARDGETVAIGGLITRNDTKNENKIPMLGDLPVFGSLFRYRTHLKQKRELLVMMTPHIVRNRIEADRVLAEESRRMDWTLGDVIKTQGPTGMSPLFPKPPEGEDVDGRMNKPILPSPSIPAGAAPFIPGNSVTPPPPPPSAVDGPYQLPLPRPQDALRTLPTPGKDPAMPAPGAPPAPAPGSVPPPPVPMPIPSNGGAVPPGATSQEPKAAMPPPVTTTSFTPPEPKADRPLQGISTLGTNATAPTSPPVSQPVPNDGKESSRWGIFGKRR